jgi:hypothetical protein
MIHEMMPKFNGYLVHLLESCKWDFLYVVGNGSLICGNVTRFCIKTIYYKIMILWTLGYNNFLVLDMIKCGWWKLLMELHAWWPQEDK